MKTRRATAALLISLLYCAAAGAEILHGIGPYDTLADVKKRYPNATFTTVSAAWVKRDERFVAMQGTCFPGALRLLFDDSRPLFRDIERDCLEKAASDQDAVAKCKQLWGPVISEDDDHALSIRWVRWVPPAAIPLTRYKSKYGEPLVEFSNEDMTPIATWPSVALSAQLSDDKQNVLYVDTAFTRAERRSAWLRRYGTLPPSLADDADEQSTPPAARTPSRNQKQRQKPAGSL